MGNTVKIRIGLVSATLILLGVVFLGRNNPSRQEVPKEQSEKNIEVVKEVPLGDASIHLEEETGPEKKMPSKVPIFMYHYIRDYSVLSDPIGENLSVTPKKFEEQMAWLKENGYQSVPLNFFETPQSVSFKPIVITFDDGYQDAYDVAFFVLKKYEMVGTFYLIVNRIGTVGYLTWDEIAQMQREGMSFGSHTFSHPDLRNLLKMDLEKEVGESKKILEQKLGKEVRDFCYPSGKYNSAVLQEVATAGYKTAVTTLPGGATLLSDPYLLKRLRITQNTKIEEVLSR